MTGINGHINLTEMAPCQGMYLWPSTAAKFAAMDADLAANGHPRMLITNPDGAYRSFDRQVVVKQQFGVGAATPGYSNHGLGRAWDINNISAYPAGIIPKFAATHGLAIDAPNGRGGIESWHMHDADGITPAALTATPIAAPIELDDDMIMIESPARGQALIGAGYFRILANAEESVTAEAIISRHVVGNDRQYDLWKSLAIGGTSAPLAS